ncbi:MAG: hypothetical protein LBR47_06860 [Spirochaetaceae bacterium]|nr:hypothetical protein [Spirochaetaceae bacterium]
MKIAYSCAGEGFGHASRMAALSPYLEKKYRVYYFIPFTMIDFLKKRIPGKIFRCIPYFTFIRNMNKIQLAKTFISSMVNIVSFPQTVMALSKYLRKLRIDVVISDFEPYLPWAARLAGIPVIQMNHPGIDRKHISVNPISWLAAAAAFLMEGPYNKCIHISFYHGDTGPVIRRGLLQQQKVNGNFILVNIKSAIREKVLTQLQSYCDIPFVVYPNPDGDFERDMNCCLAVISNAGHQTLSEALVLRKPVLSIPEENQYEQILNARMLKESGLGEWCFVECVGPAMTRFLANLSAYQMPRILPPGFNIEDSTSELHETLDRFIMQLTGKESISIGPEKHTESHSA